MFSKPSIAFPYQNKYLKWFKTKLTACVFFLIETPLGDTCDSSAKIILFQNCFQYYSDTSDKKLVEVLLRVKCLCDTYVPLILLESFLLGDLSELPLTHSKTLPESFSRFTMYFLIYLMGHYCVNWLYSLSKYSLTVSFDFQSANMVLLHSELLKNK